MSQSGVHLWRDGLTLGEVLTFTGDEPEHFAGKTIGIIREGAETLLDFNDPETKEFLLEANDYVEVWEQGIIEPIRPSR